MPSSPCSQAAPEAVLELGLILPCWEPFPAQLLCWGQQAECGVMVPRQLCPSPEVQARLWLGLCCPVGPWGILDGGHSRSDQNPRDWESHTKNTSLLLQFQTAATQEKTSIASLLGVKLRRGWVALWGSGTWKLIPMGVRLDAVCSHQGVGHLVDQTRFLWCPPQQQIFFSYEVCLLPLSISKEIFFLIEGLVEAFSVPLDININTSQRILRRMTHIFVQWCFECIFFNTE